MIFTTCGRAGAHGPTVAECRNYYSGHSWTKDYFRMDKPGYQKFIIPRQGMYKFTVYGAGHIGSYRAYGAKVETVMYLHKMQEIELIVGQVRVKFCFRVTVRRRPLPSRGRKEPAKRMESTLGASIK